MWCAHTMMLSPTMPDDRQHGGVVVEQRFAGEHRRQFHDRGDRREHDDVDLGMAHQPEQVRRTATGCRRRRPRRTGRSTVRSTPSRTIDAMNIGKAGMASPTLAMRAPHEDRRAVPGHPAGAHRQDRRRDVRAGDGAGDREDDDRHRGRRPCRAAPGPTAGRSPLHPVGMPPRNAAENSTGTKRHEQPEAQRVQPGERHVPRADHDRHDEVPERAGDHDDRREDHASARAGRRRSCRSAGERKPESGRDQVGPDHHRQRAADGRAGPS